MSNEIIPLLLNEKNVGDGASLWQNAKGPVALTGLTSSVKVGFLCALQEKAGAKQPLVIFTANRETAGSWRTSIRTWPCGSCIPPA